MAIECNSPDMPSAFPVELLNLLHLSNDTLATLFDIETSLSMEKVSIIETEVSIAQKRGAFLHATDRSRERDIIRTMEADVRDRAEDAEEKEKSLKRLNEMALGVRAKVLRMIEKAKAKCEEPQLTQKRETLLALREQADALRKEIDSLLDNLSIEGQSEPDDLGRDEESSESDME